MTTPDMTPEESARAIARAAHERLCTDPFVCCEYDMGLGDRKIGCDRVIEIVTRHLLSAAKLWELLAQ